MRAFVAAIVSLVLGCFLHPAWAQAPAPSGTVITIAGNGIASFSGDGGPATSATIAFQTGVGTDGTSKLSPTSCTVVTNTNNSGPGSLRDAINCANANPGLDTISFNIPGSGVQTITPGLPGLPPITNPVVIDGYTQPTSMANTLANGDNARLLIEISGAIASNNADGLVLEAGASGSIIRGLVIDRGWGAAIQIRTDTIAVEGCFLGIDPTGLIAHGSTQGVNAEFGFATSNMRVGGTTPAARNVISGNGTGILIRSGANQLVQGNFIGTDATGTAALANNTGINVRTSDTLIGGTTAAARNIIAGNGSGFGVIVTTDIASVTNTRIQGNFIGTDVTGTNALGLGSGVDLDQNTSATLVGGLTSTPGTPPGNVIGGSFNGIFFHLNAADDTIQGNLIGTDATGTSSVANATGIVVNGSSNVIGSSTSVMARNVISGNRGNGINLGNNNGTIQSNVVQGNFIGTDITGTQSLGNGGDGVFVTDSINNTIGGFVLTPGAPPANLIAGNGGHGVGVINNTTRLAVLGNSIFSNGGLGIDLNRDGVTPNDPGDSDTGPNTLQNFPVLTSVTRSGGNTTIMGTLNSNPNTTYRIEFFANDMLDPSTNGEGQSFLGFTTATTDGSGNASFTKTVSQVGPLRRVTSTATDPNGNTSEFSATDPAIVPTSASGTVITIAGNGIAGFSGDGGPALNASLNSPQGLAIGRDGTLYFSDANNYRIRAISVSGVITTIAGNGTPGTTGNGGPAVDATLSGVPSIAMDPARNALYLSDANNWVRKVDLTTGLLSRYAGTGGFGFSGDGGPATSATMALQTGVGIDGTGKLSIGDTFNDRVRQVNPVTGIITTIAGNGVTGYAGDGGPATAAQLNTPEEVVADFAGNVFLLHYGNSSNGNPNGFLRRVDVATGVINTVAGGGTQPPGNGTATSMNLEGSYALAVNPSGTQVFLNGGDPAGLFTGHQVFVLDVTTGQLALFAGTAANGFSGDGGPALNAQFNPIEGLALLPGGGLVIADTDNQRIRYIAPASINLSGDSQQTAFYLPWVSALSGDFTVSNNPNLITVNGVAVASVGGNVNINNNTSAGSIDLGSLTSAGGSLSVSNNASAGSINLASLISTTGSCDVLNNPAVGTVDLGSLSSTGGSVSINNNTSAGSVDLGSLVSTAGNCNVLNNPSAGSVDLGSLTTAGGDVSIGGNTSAGGVDLSNLTSTGGSVAISNNTAAGTIDLSSLTSVGGGASAKAAAAIVVGLDAPTVGGSLDVSGNTAATVIALSSLTTVRGDLTIASNAPNVTVNLNSLTSVGDGTNPATINLRRGTFTFANGLSVGPLVTLIGQGALSGNVTNSGRISPGPSAGRFDVTGNLFLNNSSELRMALGGVAPGDFDFLNVAGNVTLGGTLTVSLSNNFERVMTSGTSFTLLTVGNPLAGAFTNVASGGSLTTTDGYARFTVLYAGANTVRLTALAIMDSDSDGMPDWWEDQFGFNKTNAADATLDADGDGMTNAAEFLAGTDPRDPASGFRILSIAPAGPGAVTITWQSVAGKRYTVERSLDLPTFGAVSGIVLAAGPHTSFTDAAVPPGEAKAFYHVCLAP